MPNEPTILVKKADGTTARMTLSEVKKMKGDKKSTNPSPFDSVNVPLDQPETIVEQAREMLQTPELEPAPVEFLLPASEELLVVSPSTPLGVNAVEPHLLNEEIEPHEVGKPELVAAVSYDDTIAQIIRQADLSPSAELLPRFQSFIMSLIKGVRTIAQVMEYATAPVARGGLALSPEEAQRFTAALSDQAGPISRPAVIPKAMTAPAQNMSAPIKNNAAPTRPYSARSAAARIQMHDVQAPSSPSANKVVMGPIEEMKNFSLLDWRRLAATPDKAKEIILSKFTGWKEESFFLYRDTRQAWLQSPLVREYQEKLVEALNRSTRLADMATGFAAKTTLTPADITALVEVNRILAV